MINYSQWSFIDALGEWRNTSSFRTQKVYYSIGYGVGIWVKVIVIDLGANIEKLNEWLC